MKRILWFLLLALHTNLYCADDKVPQITAQMKKIENPHSRKYRCIKIAVHAGIYALLLTTAGSGIATTIESIHPYASVKALPHDVDLVSNKKQYCQYVYSEYCDLPIQNMEECKDYLTAYNYYVREACETSFFYSTPEPVAGITTDPQLIPGILTTLASTFIAFSKLGYDSYNWCTQRT